MSSPKEREKRDSREGQGIKRNRKESEETGEIETIPLYLYLLQGKQALPNCKPTSVGCPGDVKIHDTFSTPDHPQYGKHRIQAIYKLHS